jgi:hypothetical protein
MIISLFNLVPEAGLEPAHLAARDFKSLVSTYFTIRARLYYTIECKLKGDFYVLNGTSFLINSNTFFKFLNFTESPYDDGAAK